MVSTATLPNTTRAQISRSLWRVLVLLVLSIVINYIDRGNLSTAAPLLKTELALSPAERGWLLSSFFWTYASLQIVAGWLVDRYDANLVLAAGFLVWSLAGAATGMVTTFAAIFGLRLLLGVGESVAYPCYSKILANNFAEHQRGLANALIDAGSKLGPAIGMLAGGMLMARFGWRPVFIGLGLGGLLWLPAWFRWMPRAQGRKQTDMRDVPSFREILSRRPAWATFVGHFSGNYLWYFLITWLPSYLVEERDLSLGAMGALSFVLYGATAVTTTMAGWLADRSILSGTTPTRARKTCLIVGLTFASPIAAVPFVPGLWAAMALLMVSCLSYGVFASSHIAISQTIAGPIAAGKWTGLQNCVANMAGVTAPAITGLVVERTGHFFGAFAVAAAVVLIGAAGYAFFLGPVEPLRWRARSEPLPR